MVVSIYQPSELETVRVARAQATDSTLAALRLCTLNYEANALCFLQTVTILARHDHSSDYDERLRTFGWHRLSHRRTVARVRLVAVAAGPSLAGSYLASVPRISSRTVCPIPLRTCTRRHEASLFPSAVSSYLSLQSARTCPPLPGTGDELRDFSRTALRALRAQ